MVAAGAETSVSAQHLRCAAICARFTSAGDDVWTRDRRWMDVRSTMDGVTRGTACSVCRALIALYVVAHNVVRLRVPYGEFVRSNA